MSNEDFDFNNDKCLESLDEYNTFFEDFYSLEDY
jgi:hypothetical protein